MRPNIELTDEDWDTLEGCLIATQIGNESAAMIHELFEVRRISRTAAIRQQELLERVFNHPQRRLFKR